MDTAKKTPASLSERVSKAEKEIEKRLTILWHELPAWRRDNHYILRGYRPTSNSYLISAKSLSYLHNQTVNIYTHLIGFLLAILSGIVLYFVLEPRYATATREDVFVLSCFFAGAAVCLGMSATYHTISNHSHAVASFGNKLDYLGIVFLIWGSFVPTLYYGFQSEPHLMKFYWAMITTIGSGCSIVSIHPKFGAPALRPFRASMFVFMGLSAVLPMIHCCWLHGVATMKNTVGLYWVVLQGFLYILGAGIYAARIPERLSPGTFDIWGSSHQIFHVLVVLAAASHCIGVIIAFDYEHSNRSEQTYSRLFPTSWWF
ncbi:HlyIII-domain-containing protein [Lepidopterella palustris CBS 459.81]|uniref:HlyIII-domain-containing protein n=1 Tax=Lepidopterella palustris CBS 459.81 TaxID=1314670 RepID=A0A8E2JBV1_9PEZI|nr:HlyIII-domain-containing protein [Lepidopterella palustris CBS 459.81]